MTNQKWLIALTLSMLVASDALAQSCDAHFTFDGNLSDSSGNGYDGQMIGKDGAPATPSFVPGRSGQALQFDGASTMKAFVDLHQDNCPHVTITAWIKTTDAFGAGAMDIFSTGIGLGPGIRSSGSALQLRGPANGIRQQGALEVNGGWQFVAGVYDFENKVYKLHWGGRHTALKNLRDTHPPPRQAIWVGAFNDSLSGAAAGLVVDELRIYGHAFGNAEIQDLRAGNPVDIYEAGDDAVPAVASSSCSSHAQCGVGTYCANDGTCHPQSHYPIGETLLTPTSDEPGSGPAGTAALGSRSLIETEIDVDNLNEEYFLGLWCVVGGSQAWTRKFRSIQFASQPDYYYDFEDSPGHMQEGTQWYWRPDEGTVEVTEFWGDGQSEASLFYGRVMNAKANSFRVSENSQIELARGACDDSESFDASTLNADYFVGRWCSASVSEEAELIRGNYDFNSDGALTVSGISADSPNGQRHSLPDVNYSWSWQADLSRMSIADSVLTDHRTVSEVTPRSFKWDGNSNVSFTRCQ